MKKYIATFLIMAGMALGTVTTTYNTETYACNGSATVFSFGFPIAGVDTSQLQVILRTKATGEQTVLDEGHDYTVSAPNNNYYNGGKVTTHQTYSNAYTITIVRKTPVKQTADLSTKSSVSYSSLEAYFDKMIMIIQDLTQKLVLTLTAPASDSGTSHEIPEAAIRANKYLAFDSDGNPIASAGTVGPVAASAFGESLVDDVDAAAARTTLGLGDISTLNIDTDGALTANSDALIATQKAVKTYSDSTAQTMANKTLASPVINTGTLESPVINTGVSGTAVLDEDNMASDSNTQLATQQSIKAYVDNSIDDLEVKDITGSYDSGSWAACSTGTTATITHNLGSQLVNVVVLFSENSNGSNAVVQQFHQDSGQAIGVQVQQIAANSLVVQFGATNVGYILNSSGAIVAKSSGYYRVLVTRLK